MPEPNWAGRDTTTAGGASGAAVTAREQFYGGTPTSVAASGTHPLNWYHGSNDNLVTLTDRTQPAVIEAGVYALSVSVQFTGPGTLATGDTYALTLTMDVDNDVMQNESTAPFATAGLAVPELTIGATWYLAAGAKIKLDVARYDADSSARNFKIWEANLQKLT